MCIFLNKWKSFEPTTKYLSVVSELTSITKLYDYSQKFEWVAEKKTIGKHLSNLWMMVSEIVKTLRGGM